MFTMVTESTRRTMSAVAAVAVVAFAGLVLDQGHAGALPEGTVEVGQLTPINLMQMAAVTLPEIVVTGERVALARSAASLPMLPEVVVVASREVQVATAAAGRPVQS